MAARQLPVSDSDNSEPRELESRTSEDVVVDIVRWVLRIYLAPFLLVGWLLLKTVILMWTAAVKVTSFVAAVIHRPRMPHFHALKRPRSRVLKIF